MSNTSNVSQVSSLLEEIIRDRIDVYPFFADLVGSTKYKRTLAEAQMPEIWWIYRQRLFLQEASEILVRRSGTVVKTIGDEVFGYFPYSTTPSAIVKAGVEIIQGFSDLKHFSGEHEIVARVGIDFGSTYNGSVLDYIDYDPIGTPVDRCARIQR